MEQIKEIWSGASEIPGANWIIGIAGLIISVLLAYYCVKLFRDMALGRASDEPTDILTEFKRLRDEGTLDDEEFERLANVLPRESDSPDSNEPPSDKPNTPIVP